MPKTAISLALVALAVLAGCATEAPVTPAPVVVTPAPVVTAPAPTVVVPPSASAPAPVVVPAAPALRPGFGRVESISALPQSAAAGGQTMHRLGIKMEDGTLQYVDTTFRTVAIGDRVELTADGRIRF